MLGFSPIRAAPENREKHGRRTVHQCQRTLPSPSGACGAAAAARRGHDPALAGPASRCGRQRSVRSRGTWSPPAVAHDRSHPAHRGRVRARAVVGGGNLDPQPEGKVVPLNEVADAAGDQGAPPGVPGDRLLDPLGLSSNGCSLVLRHACIPPSLEGRRLPPWPSRCRAAPPERSDSPGLRRRVALNQADPAREDAAPRSEVVADRHGAVTAEVRWCRLSASCHHPSRVISALGGPHLILMNWMNE